MNTFVKELESGEIHQSDRLQFELKSEFIPLIADRVSIFAQELYIFIPNSLQINPSTYSKEQFYRDETHFIRYKTPPFTFRRLIDPENALSPINCIRKRLSVMEEEGEKREIEDELKLLGNIARSALRDRVIILVRQLENGTAKEQPIGFCEQCIKLRDEVVAFREAYGALKEEALGRCLDEKLNTYFVYIDEFLSNTIDYYFSGLLYKMRSYRNPDFAGADAVIVAEIIKEKADRTSITVEPEEVDEGSIASEEVFYRRGLLKKFVIDALLLNTSRSSPDLALQNIVGSLAAGIAMLFYFLFFIWQGQVFVINSEPFIIATVLLYILKDRLKEVLKSISYRLAFRWFSDYTTKIRSPKGDVILGALKESFSFIDVKKLPEEIISVRNREFHVVLEDFRRPESVMHYKQTIEMEPKSHTALGRRNSLNVIFRFNISHFLDKADDPYHSYVSLDEATGDSIVMRLPKVYHLNIIMKNHYMHEDGTFHDELKKFRLIIDKDGIKRIDHITGNLYR